MVEKLLPMMKLSFSPTYVASLLIGASLLFSSVSRGSLVVHYTFEQTGTSITNAGTLGASANLATFNAVDVSTDLITADGTGVGGNGRAVNFVGTPNAAGPYGITAGSISLNLTNGFVISGWLDMASWNSGASVFRNNDGTSGPMLLISGNSTSSSMTVSLGNGTANTPLSSNTDAYNGAVGEGWMFFAVAWDGSTITFYRGDDDVASLLSAVGTASYTDTIANPPVTQFALGNTPAAANNRPLNGLMDDFRIYDNYLDATAINDVRVEAIPEPSQVALIMAGLAVCLVVVARKRRQSA